MILHRSEGFAMFSLWASLSSIPLLVYPMEKKPYDKAAPVSLMLIGYPDESAVMLASEPVRNAG